MISETVVLENLRKLDVLYTAAVHDMERLFYSKLAILEVCGWIEESVDGIIRDCANRKLHDEVLKKIVEDVLERNSGFDYHKNFRYVLFHVVGLIGIERLETSVDVRKFQVMCSALANLKTPRNDLAHTHITGVTRTINAPSWTILQLSHVYEGLKEIDEKLVEIGL